MNKILLLLGIIFLTLSTKSQTCGTCSININGLDSSSYSIGPGQTFCVDTTGNFIGSITLSGGTVCNRGMFHPQTISFSSGTLNNSSNSSFQANLNVGNAVILNNMPGGVLSISGSLSLSGGTLINDGILNVTQAISNASGSFSNSNIINCSQLSGANSVTNNGVINTN